MPSKILQVWHKFPTKHGYQAALSRELGLISQKPRTDQGELPACVNLGDLVSHVLVLMSDVTVIEIGVVISYLLRRVSTSSNCQPGPSLIHSLLEVGIIPLLQVINHQRFVHNFIASRPC